MRVKAASVGLRAEEYRAELAVSTGWTGMVELDATSAELRRPVRRAARWTSRPRATCPATPASCCSAPARPRSPGSRRARSCGWSRTATRSASTAGPPSSGWRSTSCSTRQRRHRLPRRPGRDGQVGARAVRRARGRARARPAHEGRRVPPALRRRRPGPRLPPRLGGREDGALGAGRLRHPRRRHLQGRDRGGHGPRPPGGPAADPHPRAFAARRVRHRRRGAVARAQRAAHRAQPHRAGLPGRPHPRRGPARQPARRAPRRRRGRGREAQGPPALRPRHAAPVGAFARSPPSSPRCWRTSASEGHGLVRRSPGEPRGGPGRDGSPPRAPRLFRFDNGAVAWFPRASSRPSWSRWCRGRHLRGGRRGDRARCARDHDRGPARADSVAVPAAAPATVAADPAVEAQRGRRRAAGEPGRRAHPGRGPDRHRRHAAGRRPGRPERRDRPRSPTRSRRPGRRPRPRRRRPPPRRSVGPRSRRRGTRSGSRTRARWPSQILENKFGYGSDQFSCFDWIIKHESGWNVHAQNASSGAYGLPQSLPGSKMASVASDWRDNPATQIIWGAQYMKSRTAAPAAPSRTGRVPATTESSCALSVRTLRALWSSPFPPRSHDGKACRALSSVQAEARSSAVVGLPEAPNRPRVRAAVASLKDASSRPPRPRRGRSGDVRGGRPG